MSAYEIYIAYATIVRKEIQRFMRIWVQTLLPPSIIMVLYFIIFGNLIGTRIGQMGGFDYMQFIVPGLIMMSVITNSYGNVVSSFYSTKYQGNLEEMLVSPMPNWVILAGYITGGVARGLAVGTIVTSLSLFIILVVLMTSILFSLGGFINAVFANSFDDISIVPTFILTPLTYLGGVFYSIDLLPDFWAGASLLNPILYMVNAFRYGILGVSDIAVGYALLVISVFIVALFSYCMYLLNTGKGIRK
jgi:ABC-2 type transport system permease protein